MAAVNLRLNMESGGVPAVDEQRAGGTPAVPAGNLRAPPGDDT